MFQDRRSGAATLLECVLLEWLLQWLRRRWCVPYVTSDGSKGRQRLPDPLVFTVKLTATIVSDNPDSPRRLTLGIKRNDQQWAARIPARRKIVRADARVVSHCDPKPLHMG